MEVQKLKRFLITLIATAGGAGFSPRAPGTMGTVMGLLIGLLTRPWSDHAFFTLAVVLFFAGWWATWEWSRATGASDSQQIVIDEVLGYWVAIGAFPREPSILFIQFVLFRFFDVLKPEPIRSLDRWGKRFPIGPLQSLGVILDDLLAGLFAAGVLTLGFKTLPLSLWLGVSP